MPLMALSYDLPTPRFERTSLLMEAINTDEDTIEASGYVVMWVVPDGVWLDWVTAEFGWYDGASSVADVSARLVIADPDVVAGDPDGVMWGSAPLDSASNAAGGGETAHFRFDTHQVPSGWAVGLLIGSQGGQGAVALPEDASVIVRFVAQGQHTSRLP